MLHRGARDKVNKELENLLKRGGVSSVENTFIKKLTDEMWHIMVVRKTMQKITGKDSFHGWSKDHYYMAVMILGGDKRLKNIQVKLKEEHYESEGYNIEHMDYCGHLLSDEQILELTIERIGRYYFLDEHATILELEPKFRQCPVMGCLRDFGEEKCQHELDFIQKFRSNVEKYVDMVFDAWKQ